MLEREDVVTKWDEVASHIDCLKQIKLKSCFILYMNRALVTKKQLSKYVPNITPFCDNCPEVVETYVHLFWECPRIQTTWKQIANVISVRTKEKVHLDKICWVYSHQSCVS